MYRNVSEYTPLVRLCAFLLAVYGSPPVCAGIGVDQLQPGDRISIEVSGHEDLSGEFQLDEKGDLTLPLIERVSAANLTAEALAAIIVDKLQPDYLKNPRVRVQLLSYRPFYIMGEVRQPGRYKYVSGMTVLTAVALAGGYTDCAMNNVVHIKRSKAGEPYRTSATEKAPVFPGDVLHVPPRN